MSNIKEGNMQNCIVCTELPHHMLISLVLLQICKYFIYCNLSNKYDLH
jgi:hypothetical protein